MMSAIDQAFLDEVLARIAVAPDRGFDALTQTLRKLHPGVHITVCGEGDIPARARPAARSDVGLICCVASDGHCLSLTDDMASATGIVVALRDDD